MIKNNIPKQNKDGTVTKHYYELERKVSCGVCDWVYLIPTIRTCVCNKYFEIEIDIFVFYIFIVYDMTDIDNDES